MKKVIFCILVLLSTVMLFASSSGHGSEEPNMTHRMMMLAIQIGIIVFAAKAGNILFEKIKLPGVLGELSSGMIIGPFLLGSIPFYGFPDGLFPIIGNFPVSPELYGFCAIASIILLFMVGLETDLDLFMRFSLAGSFIGIGGVVGSFLAGDLLAVLLSGLISSEPLHFFSAPSLFLGTISTATSVGITARILSEKKKMDSQEGVSILAGAVIDDVLGIIVLAIVLGILNASSHSGTIDWGNIGLISLKTIGFWLVFTILGLVLSRQISKFLKIFKGKSSIALMGLGLALILAGVFEQAGLAMIVGAYIMGLSISKTDVAHVIQEKLHPIYEFLVPIFFCVMGMLVDFKAFSSVNIVIFGLIYSVVAIAAKILGCSFPALFFNFNLRGALRIGVGMVPRGEVALIIAGVGLSAGLLSPSIFGVSIIMTLLTTMIAPPVLVGLFNNKSGLRRQTKAEEGTSISFDFPSPELTSLMVEKLAALFEQEGFFVNLIDHERLIYQIRKDRTIIGLQKSETRITFDTKKENESFIYTALYLIIGDIENTMKALQVPLDKAKIATKLQDALDNSDQKRRFLDLTQFLNPRLIEPKLKGETKDEIIEELIKLVCKNDGIADKDAIKQAVLSREAIMSTGMQHGIAIPHGKTDVIKKLICAVGIKREGIDFESLDGQPSRIFVITLSPQNSPSPHIQFMSSISHRLTEENRELALKTSSRKKLYSIITGKEYKRKEIKKK